MNFVTFEFLLFFLTTLTLWLLFAPFARLRLALLLVCNLFFYSTAGRYYLPLLLGVGLFNWLMGKIIAKSSRWRKVWLFLGICTNIFILGLFKYSEFFILEAQVFLSSFGISLRLDTFLPEALLELPFPIGLSFYVFQAIAYLAEIASKRQRSESFFKVLLYLSFFPTILAGPIMRPWQFFPQIRFLLAGQKIIALPGKPTRIQDESPLWDQEKEIIHGENSQNILPVQGVAEQIPKALAFIVSGLFKKVVLASFLSEHVVRDVFQGPEAYSSLAVLTAVYGYAVQIFCDFSGYTDLALGLALLLGFSLPQNFNAPYLACNLQDFWRRWHITLSTWLRDYVYIPLGGSRQGNRYVNLALTMILGGLWHGAHARFLVWGALHGFGLICVHGVHQCKSRFFPKDQKNGSSQKSWLGGFLGWLVTFHFVSLAWVFFRAEDMDKALEILHRLFVWNQPGQGFLLLALPAIGCGLLLQIMGRFIFTWFVHAQARLPVIFQALTTALLTSMIFRMGPDGVLPFIYFQF
ncbi:MAG: MBOAT family O-acyltransferase [Desulfomicrobium sp.]|nr:MBOAT family O-acyltransferase [Desulfomicrobium sp.]